MMGNQLRRKINGKNTEEKSNWRIGRKNIVNLRGTKMFWREVNSARKSKEQMSQFIKAKNVELGTGWDEVRSR